MTTSSPAVGARHPLARDMPGFVRELSVFERLYSGRVQHMGYLTNALHIVSKVPLTEELVHSALQRLMRMIPTFRYVIRDQRPGGTPLEHPVFVELADPQIDLKTLETTEWIDVLSQEWDVKFDVYNGPCWRVKFLPNVKLDHTDDTFKYGGVVIFTFVHSIIDGITYQRTFSHFLDCLEAVVAGVTGEPVKFQPYPPLDYYLDEKPGMFDGIIRTLLCIILRSSKGRRIFSWFSGLGKQQKYLACNKLPIEEDPSTPEVSSVVPMVISREDTACIVQAAKARGATVHGVLMTAAAFAYSKMIQNNYPINMMLNTFTPVNMRRFFRELSLDSYGIYVQAVSFQMLLKVKSGRDEYEALWSLAKSTTSEVRKQIEMKSYLHFNASSRNILPALETYHPPIRELAPFKYGRDANDFYVTNMMKCDYLTRGDDANFKLVGRFGGISMGEAGCIIGNNLNTFNGQIYWTLIYDKHILHRQRVVAYGNIIQETLRKMCGDSAV